MPKRTYLDSGVLIAAFKGKGEIGKRALEILDDAERTLVVSDAVRLEIFPKAEFHKKQPEIAFYQEIFDNSELVPWIDSTLNVAYRIASQHGIAAMDAIHIAHAIKAQVDEFYTSEKSDKPIFRINDFRVLSLHE